MSKARKPAAFRIVEALTPQLPALVAAIRESPTPEFRLTMMSPDQGSATINPVEFDGIRAAHRSADPTRLRKMGFQP
jgi:hypothetical protein